MEYREKFGFEQDGANFQIYSLILGSTKKPPGGFRRPQGGFQRVRGSTRSSQKDPGRPQEAPERPQEATRRPQGSPREAPEKVGKIIVFCQPLKNWRMYWVLC